VIGEAFNAKWECGGPEVEARKAKRTNILKLNMSSVTNLGHLLTRYLEHLSQYLMSLFRALNDFSFSDGFSGTWD
jgi:hypothetical protein